VRREGLAGRDAIPALPERRDEIGDLADSLKAMTATLYDRIGATERFAADVAHELKNPLTSLASAMEMLVRAPDDATRQKLMALVRADVKRIDRLITDISDASRLDAELSRERHSVIELSHLLKTIVEIYDLTEISKGQTVTLLDELPSGTRVMGNDERLGQVFRNLIDNAISFSPANGVIMIRAQRSHGVARVTVEDRGPGIPPDNLESIFERFYTERPAMHFGNNSGLGLSIARQITENASGRIWAENMDGGGARFVVEFPVLP
jgi:two-component system sensor histidine kinase ChvG